MDGWMYVCTYACMHAWMDVCMYVSIHTYIYILYIYIYILVYIGSSQVLELHTMGWGDGVGLCELAEAVDATHTRGGVGGDGMLTFM